MFVLLLELNFLDLTQDVTKQKKKSNEKKWKECENSLQQIKRFKWNKRNDFVVIHKDRSDKLRPLHTQLTIKLPHQIANEMDKNEISP